MEPTFDAYKNSYQSVVEDSIAFIGQDLDFFTALKIDALLRLARSRWPRLNEKELLDLGCGVGLADALLVPHFGAVHGLDTSAGSIETARRANPGVDYRQYDGARFPYETGSMDVAFAMNVFHHIPPARWDATLEEMHRVLKPGGLAVIFEHNPLNPLTRLAVSRCAFDAEAVLLHAGDLTRRFKRCKFGEVRRDYVVFFPWNGRALRSLERALAWCPLGAQYFVAGTR